MERIINVLVIIILILTFTKGTQELKSIVIMGFLLSIPFSIGLWFGKQAEKTKTLIPAGKTTGKYGYIICCVICTLTIVMLFVWGIKYKFMIIVGVVSIYLFSIYLTVLIERILYCKKWIINKLEVNAIQCVAKYKDEAPMIWERLVPRWWLNMMSKKWEKQYI